MKLAPTLRLFALLAFILVAKSRAQSAFTLNVVPSTTVASSNGVINYTITVVNNTSIPLVGTHVSATFPTSFVINNASDNVPGAFPPNPLANPITTGGGFVDYQVDTFPIGQVYTFLLGLKMTTANSFTTTVSVTNQARSIAVTTNVVTGAGSGGGTTTTNSSSDLAVSVSGLTGAALVNDLITYSLTARNNGPGTASKVIVNNTVPPGTTLVSSSAPSSVTKSGNVISWQVGSLAASASQVLSLSILTTNAVETNIVATISAPSNTDGTASNDSVTSGISVQPIISTNLAFTRGAQTFNRNTGLFEETETIQNIGSITLPTTRIFIAGGLTASDFVFNEAGTNGTAPYVLYPNALAPGASTNVLVQFYFHDRKFNTTQTLTAVQGPLGAASTNAVSASINLTNIVLTNNVITFELPTVTNKTFSIQQSSSVLFTNAQTVSTNNLITGTNKIIFTNSVDLTKNLFFRAVQNP